MSATLRERAFTATVACAVPLLRALARGEGKLARGVRGRAGAADRLIAWQRALDRPERPIVWVHAPSVGEALMSKAIIAALRVRLPDARVVFTAFSPSAERVIAQVGADVADYLPWDTPGHVGRAVAVLRPAAVACVRTEVWPLLARAAAHAGGAVALVNAVISTSSGRLRGPARWLLAPTYARLDAVGAVSADDEMLFHRMGVPAQRIRMTGDARFDQVWQRVSALRADEARIARMRALLPAGRPIVVAGSTWPQDERHLASAMRALRSSGIAPVWVIAPHEPSDGHLAALEQGLREAGLDPTRMAVAESGQAVADALLVDRVGVLADLYSIADVAYVGGGFHDQGLHSVVEPAALGVPVVFGPRLGNAREAGELAREGGGLQVEGADALTAAMRALLDDDATRRAASRGAAAFVQERLGGGDRNAALIAELVETRARPQGTV
jgi:3-deoxy-D-manno-octulosonic-acid transferase